MVGFRFRFRVRTAYSRLAYTVPPYALFSRAFCRVENGKHALIQEGIQLMMRVGVGVRVRVRVRVRMKGRD